MRPRVGTVEQEIARVADRQHGVVTHTQLIAAGVSAAGIQRRVRKGALFVEHRGVYRVGHRAPSIEARYMAAVLACGNRALLCGRAAAWLHGLLRGAAPAPEVTARSARRIRGVVTHVTRKPHPREGTTVRAIPVTRVARTLVDVAAVLGVDELARACHEAGVRHGTTPRQVETVLRRRPRARGAGRLRSILSGDAKVTLSRLERRFLDLLRAEGLVLPETNRPAGGRRVDCRWPEQRLTVELDSYRFHNSRHAWEQDRRREREARARGDDFRRYTWGDVFERPKPVLAELRGVVPRQDLN